jgi:hypothetical protein
MRFFEFKLPSANSPLLNKIVSSITDLVNSAKKLPENDPARKEADDLINSLKNKAGITESDAISELEHDMIVAIAKALISTGNQQATLSLIDIEKIKKNIEVQQKTKKVAQAHQELGKQQYVKSQETDTSDLDEIGAAIEKKLGTPKGWTKSKIINPLLSVGIDKELLYVFLDQCASGTAMNWNFNDGIHPITDFKSLMSDESKEIFSNKQAKDILLTARWSEAGGEGDGEVMIGLLADASHPEKGDITVKGVPYEVKATGWRFNKKGDVSGTEAWLDAGPYSSNIEGVKAIFKKLINARGITASEENIALADFRKAGTQSLKQIMSRVKDPVDLMSSLHSAVFPNADKNQIKQASENIVASQYDYRVSAKEQGLLAMAEYAAEHDNFGFVFIDKTNFSGMISKNAVGESEAFTFSSPMTMSTAKTTDATTTTKKRKASPGIMTGSRAQAQKTLGWQSKRQPAQPAVSTALANDPKKGFYSKYDKATMDQILTTFKDRKQLVADYKSLTLPEFEKKYVEPILQPKLI